MSILFLAIYRYMVGMTHEDAVARRLEMLTLDPSKVARVPLIGEGKNEAKIIEEKNAAKVSETTESKTDIQKDTTKA